MNMDQYQAAAHVTAEYPTVVQRAYLGLGTSGEASEILEKQLQSYLISGNLDELLIAVMIAIKAGKISELIKKDLRGDFVSRADELDNLLDRETGDLLWYLSELSFVRGKNFSDIAVQNINKLADRRERNVTKGQGDTR